MCLCMCDQKKRLLTHTIRILLSGSLSFLHFTRSYDLMTVLSEGEKEQRGRRELKNQTLGLKLWFYGRQHYTRCVSPHHHLTSLCFTLPKLPSLSHWFSLPSHMFSLSSFSSHLILSLSLTDSTGWEYLRELWPGCKEHSRSGICRSWHFPI